MLITRLSAATSFICVLLLHAVDASAQIEERWILYGYYVNDVGIRTGARYRIEHPAEPWQISLAQYGHEPVEFIGEAISADLDTMRFEWPGRRFGQCAVRRVVTGEETYESVWAGSCRTVDGGAVRELAIGAEQRPSLGRELPVTKIDLQIVDRAVDLLAERQWHKADDRVCSDDIRRGRFSLFCSIFTASVEVTGEYLHRRPAARALRDAVYEMGEARIDSHTLMDYNNHPETTYQEIMDRLADARRALIAQLDGGSL